MTGQLQVPTPWAEAPSTSTAAGDPVRFFPLQEMLNFRRKCFDPPKHTTVGEHFPLQQLWSWNEEPEPILGSHSQAGMR